MANNPAAERGLKLLEKCTLFSALDDKARGELAAHAHPRHFAAGDAICRIDEHGDSMMAVMICGPAKCSARSRCSTASRVPPMPPRSPIAS
jgi:hypothetical protein